VELDYQALPFMEQQSLYEETNGNVIKATPVATFYCPSRRRPRAYSTGAKTDYAACAGSSGTVGSSNGVMVSRGSQGWVRFADILDGTSTTLLAGGKQLNRKRLGQTYDDNEPYVGPGWDSEIYRIGSASHPPGPDSEHTSLTAADPDSGSNRFGSAHPGIFNAVLADGSGRPISYEVDVELFRRLCVMNDGEAITLP